MPTHYEGTPQEVLALNAFIKLTRATDSLLARLARREAFGDLTPRQFGVLESLYHLGPMRQGEISAKLLTSGGNITLVVENLEKGGLVRRERSLEDRRVVMAEWLTSPPAHSAGDFAPPQQEAGRETSPRKQHGTAPRKQRGTSPRKQHGTAPRVGLGD